MQLKNVKNHTQMKVSERAAWVGVGYYEHGEFFGAAINSKSLRGASKFGIEIRNVMIFYEFVVFAFWW